MLKYLSKFAMDILPSVAATIIGAYIVNHYINAKPAADVPAAATASTADPAKDPVKADAKNAAKPSQTTVDVGNIPAPGVTAKGVSERAMLEKTAAEKPAVAEQPGEKPADRPAETASIPADTRRHSPVPREKTAARPVPAPVQPTPAAAAPVAAPPVETAVAPEDHRDANDLARAAIERLRGSNDGSARTHEAARIPDAPRPAAPAPPVTSPVASAPSVQPLPPPIMVATPAAGTSDSATTGSVPAKPSAAAANDDPGRPIPPADIPQASRPLDLRAEAEPVPPRREHTNVAEDMLLAAKSVFHAVLPK
jgi:hypothetical protein